QLSELALDGAEELGAGPSAPAAPPGGPVPRRNRPVGNEAAKVVDAREIDELARAAEALDPPAVAGRAVHRPVVQGIPPVLPVRAQRVGRRARDLAVREELGPGLDVGASIRDVDRHVADQADAALARVRAQLRPLVLEPNLV